MKKLPIVIAIASMFAIASVNAAGLSGKVESAEKKIDKAEHRIDKAKSHDAKKDLKKEEKKVKDKAKKDAKKKIDKL